PFIVEQYAVSLKSVHDALSFPVALLQRHHVTKKIDAAQRGFTSLPGKVNVIIRLGSNLLANKRLQSGLAHLGLFGFIDIKTVTAVQVTARAGRFGHHMTSCHYFSSIKEII